MSASERRQAEKEMIREKILAASSRILAKEGYDKLSIRKIATQIEYSPGVIYHYFKDKAEIITFITRQGYSKLLEQIEETPIDQEQPDKTLETSLRAYIKLMLSKPNHFKANVIKDVENVDKQPGILQDGSFDQRQGLSIVIQILELGMSTGKFRTLDPKLTAQIIWTSTYGLVTRLILENQLPKAQQERLIDHHFEVLIHGLLRK
ncbi:TetR/AcrR family transcriptional regulator [Paenibacillus albiflavus]|uniref:TetR/AcrR family transcriptional regulator n=1 Tax=Paenibacillus albiflavus TaxID=2545760 RepID=A0A4R4EA27_9BACL|nr:TetR/AcrR family transcriptional regulator [Paenibacillus albiflavus]TCZ75883.1 TetR/AcrR family transcriptional regulator [Paenibacillus albiflavus]